MADALARSCPRCGQAMVLVGSFWVCGGHPEPVTVTVEPAAPTSEARALSLDVLPTPIALSIAEYQQERSPFVALHRLVDAAELITRLFAIVALADQRQREGDLPEPLKRLLVGTLARPTFGA